MIKRKPILIKRIWQSPQVQKWANLALPVLFGVVLLFLWQTEILHSWFGTDTFTLPLPERIIAIIINNAGKIAENIAATVTAALSGLILGSLIGYGIAMLAALFPKWGRGGLSIVAAFNAIPIVALAPVMTNWTKGVSSDASLRSMVAKILVVMIVSIASMSINAYRGLVELKPYAEDLMLSYAAGRKVTFIKLRLPNSVPYIFTALKVSVPSSVISALVSEYFAEYIIGLGRQIRENIVLAQYATAWAYISVACLIGIAMYVVLILAEAVVKRKRKL